MSGTYHQPTFRLSFVTSRGITRYFTALAGITGCFSALIRSIAKWRTPRDVECPPAAPDRSAGRRRYEHDAARCEASLTDGPRGIKTRLDSQQCSCTTLRRLDDTRTSGQDHLTRAPCSMISGPGQHRVYSGPMETFRMGTVARGDAPCRWGGEAPKIDRSSGRVHHPATRSPTIRQCVHM